MTRLSLRRWLCVALGSSLLPAALAAGASVPGRDPAPAPPPLVSSVTIDGAITVATVEIVKAALEQARVDRPEALLVVLDTPGGDLDSTREIVRAMLESDVPTIVWVAPAGAHAGSAGVFVTMAADVAAMHPTSNIGAAHPVTGSGKDVEAEAGKDMAKKVENDTAAFARSIAAAKGRSADWAEKAVRESVAVTADEAVKQHVVDFLAADRAALLAQADGRTVKTAAGPHVLRLKGAAVVPFSLTVRQRVLLVISNPALVAILMLVGLLGIGVEFYHPGALFPGIAGAFCLLVGLLGTRVIPVNVGAVLLVVAGVGLIVSEGFFTSHGLAGLGGATCLVLGLLFFVDASAPGQWADPGAFSLSAWLVWPTPVVLAALLLFVGWKVARGRRAQLQLGAPALLGLAGEVLSEVGPEGGQVFLHGEYWMARSAASIPRGARVRVVRVDGLIVTVEAEREVG